jgi:hypothetical protein
MPFSATLQFRTSLDQAGRVAGLAGELGVAESEVLRLLLDRALDAKSAVLIRELRAELRGRQEPPTEAEIERAHAEGRARSST